MLFLEINVMLWICSIFMVKHWKLKFQKIMLKISENYKNFRKIMLKIEKKIK